MDSIDAPNPTWFGSPLRSGAQSRGGPMIQVSVVIPTCNRPDAIRECVDALCAQTFPHDRFEIVIIDDGSRHPVQLSAILPAHPANAEKFPRIRLVRQENKGPAAARNRGAIEAEGALLAFTDDDCRPIPDWLGILVAGHLLYPKALLGGSTFNGLRENLFAETNQLILDMVYDHFNADPHHAVFLASNNWLCPRQSFFELGGFDGSFRCAGGEDRDFCNRWRTSHLPIVWLPDARIEHRHKQSFRGFLNLHYRYGVGARLFHVKRSERGSGHAGEDLSFHRHIVRYLPDYLKKYHSRFRRIQILAALVIWEIANAIGFISMTIRQVFS